MGIQIKVWGDWACFTRLEMKVERVSYDALTPSAARGVLEAIYWKPQIRWVIDRITVLRPIRFTNLRRNEVGAKASAATAKTAMKKAGKGQPAAALGIVVEGERQQRAATLLRDVAYLIDAHFVYTDPRGRPLDASDDRNDAKHLDTFHRRARRGQCFHHPYLGCREFPADFALASELPADELTVAEELHGTRDLGYMLYDTDFRPDPKGPIRSGRDGRRLSAQPVFWRASMTDGVIDVAQQVAQQGVLR